eukprot:6430606-Prymnesium_polylepis.1
MECRDYVGLGCEARDHVRPREGSRAAPRRGRDAENNNFRDIVSACCDVSLRSQLSCQLSCQRPASVHLPASVLPASYQRPASNKIRAKLTRLMRGALARLARGGLGAGQGHVHHRPDSGRRDTSYTLVLKLSVDSVVRKATWFSTGKSTLAACETCGCELRVQVYKN